MSGVAFTILASALLSIVAGGFVLSDSPRRDINQAYFLFSIGVGIWIGAYGLIVATRHDVFLFMLNTGGLLLVIGLVRFSQVFPTHKPLPIRPSLFWFPLIVGGTSMILGKTIIVRVTFSPAGEMFISHGPLINLWSGLLLTYILISLQFFIRSYAKANMADRERLWFIYLGISVFALSAVVFDAILPGFFGIIHLNYIGPLTSLIFLYVTAYGVLKHQFLDIRIVIQRSAIYSLSFFLLAFCYATLLVLFEWTVKEANTFIAPLSAGITILIGTYTLPRMETYFRRITDPLFFKEAYDYFSVLEELAETLNKNLNLRPLVLHGLAIIDKTLKPKYSYFLYTKTSECFSHTNSENRGNQEDPDSRAIHVPINSEGILIGEYVLGPKRSGDPYTREDHCLLRTFASNATVAFEKAELYQQLRDHADQLEDAVQERTQHLHKFQDQQRQFFDDISHALQTPLTILKSGLELLMRTARVPEQKICSNMDAGINDLSRLTQSVLNLARIDASTSKADMTTIDLSFLVSRVAEYVALIAKAADIELAVKSVPNILIRADISQIEEALTNILSNSIKYTSGCDIRTIRISLETFNSVAGICIADSGIGMSSDELTRVFERFYRTSDKARKQQEGFGLGLSIAKRIIERHEGSIRLESISGLGTKVYITLPCV